MKPTAKGSGDERFVCTRCGECCRHVGCVDALRNLDRGDGACRHLSGSLCSIYSHRPLLCRVEEAYKLLFAPLMTREEYLQRNREICLRLQEAAGLHKQ